MTAALLACVLVLLMPDVSILRELHLDLKPAASEFVSAIATGAADEICAFGPRGEGKTWSLAAGAIAHAEEHRKAGGNLPVQWLGVTDTFESHKRNTLRSLRDPKWQGVWEITDGGHIATFRFAGADRVEFRLFGVDSPKDAAKVRTECHCVWFEEPAPAADISSGIDFRYWEIALSSRRSKPTHAHVGAITANYPDVDHWTWQRFVEDPRPGTAYIRIPRGDRTTQAERERLERTISDPVLRARLVFGEPGVIVLGERVADGFREDVHIAKAPLPVLPNVPLWFGHDSAANAHTHATVVGQHAGRVVRVLASLVTEHAGMKQHLEATVLPWLGLHAPWALRGDFADRLFHRYDPAMDTGEGGDIDQSPLRRVQDALGGHYAPGAVSWPARIGPVLSLFQSAVEGASSAALQIDPGPGATPLRRALAGRWFYPRNAAGTVIRDLPMKPNHPWEDVGDGLCYLVGGMAPERERAPARPRAPLVYKRVLGAMR